jgi:hypothetical protein
MKKQNLGRSEWLRKYPELDPYRKKPVRTKGERKLIERKKQFDLIEDARQLGNELGEVWDGS